MLVVWNGTTERQKNLLANTLTVGNVRAYSWTIAEKERRGAVDILVRLRSTLIAKIRPRVPTALVREDIYEANWYNIYLLVVAEELEGLLTRALTLSRSLSAVIMLIL